MMMRNLLAGVIGQHKFDLDASLVTDSVLRTALARRPVVRRAVEPAHRGRAAVGTEADLPARGTRTRAAPAVRDRGGVDVHPQAAVLP